MQSEVNSYKDQKQSLQLNFAWPYDENVYLQDI